MTYNAKDLALSYRKIQDSSPSPGFRKTHQIERFTGNQKDAALAASYARVYTKEEHYAPTLAKQRQERRATQNRLPPSTARGVSARRAAIRAAIADLRDVQPYVRLPSTSSRSTSQTSTPRTTTISPPSTPRQTAMTRTEDLAWRQPAAPPPSLSTMTRRLVAAAKTRLGTWRAQITRWFASRRQEA